MDCSLPGSSVHGILQARILEWVAVIKNTKNTKYTKWVYMLSHVWLFVTPWTVAHQAPLSTGFFRPEYWSGLPFPLPGDLLNPGIKPVSLTSAFVGGFFITSSTWEIPCNLYQHPFPEFFSSGITETLCPLNNNLQFPPPPSPWQPPSYLLSLWIWLL